MNNQKLYPTENLYFATAPPYPQILDIKIIFLLYVFCKFLTVQLPFIGYKKH